MPQGNLDVQAAIQRQQNPNDQEVTVKLTRRSAALILGCVDLVEAMGTTAPDGAPEFDQVRREINAAFRS